MYLDNKYRQGGQYDLSIDKVDNMISQLKHLILNIAQHVLFSDLTMSFSYMPWHECKLKQQVKNKGQVVVN